MGVVVATTGTLTILNAGIANIRITIPKRESVKLLRIATSGPLMCTGRLFQKNNDVFGVTLSAGSTQAEATIVDGDMEFNIAPLSVINEGETLNMLVTNASGTSAFCQIWLMT